MNTRDAEGSAEAERFPQHQVNIGDSDDAIMIVAMVTRRLHRHGTASERYDPRGVRHQTVVALLLVGNRRRLHMHKQSDYPADDRSSGCRSVWCMVGTSLPGARKRGKPTSQTQMDKVAPFRIQLSCIYRIWSMVFTFVV